MTVSPRARRGGRRRRAAWYPSHPGGPRADFAAADGPRLGHPLERRHRPRALPAVPAGPATATPRPPRARACSSEGGATCAPALRVAASASALGASPSASPCVAARHAGPSTRRCRSPRTTTAWWPPWPSSRRTAGRHGSSPRSRATRWARVGINPTITLEKQLLNMIGNLV